MKTKTISALFAFLSLFFIGATSAHAAAPEAHTKIQIPHGLSQAGVHDAVVKAAIGRRWNIIEKEDNNTVIHLQHRGYDSTLTFTVRNSELLIFSDSWTVNKKGEKKKRKDPAGWIENLRKDIIVFMNRELYG